MDSQTIADNMYGHILEWQPIATAPKDGTRLLVVNDLGTVDIARWEGGPERWIVWDGQGWIRPTHWMPLPSPPSAVAAPGQDV